MEVLEGRAAGHPLPLVGEMGLVIEAGGEGYSAEVGVRLPFQQPGGVIEPSQPGEDLGRHPQFLAQAVAEVADAPAQVEGEFLDPYRSVAASRDLPRPDHLR